VHRQMKTARQIAPLSLGSRRRQLEQRCTWELGDADVGSCEHANRPRVIVPHAAGVIADVHEAIVQDDAGIRSVARARRKWWGERRREPNKAIETDAKKAAPLIGTPLGKATPRRELG